MSGKKRRKVLFAVLAGAAVIIMGMYVPSAEVFAYDATDEVLPVPYAGLAPSGEEEDLCADTSLVYAEVTLKEIEPQEDVFAFAETEERFHLDKWKAMGRHMVLRLILDRPGNTAHRDIPDWLYAETGDGTDYDNAYGKGYCPDYTNPILIAAHRKAVKALAEWAEEDDFAAYVEIGSLGHWGEWHILSEDESLPRFPDAEIQQEYVDAYTDAFQTARLLMRRPFALRPQGAGVYNDVTGDREETEEWLAWLAEGGTFEQTGEALKAAPEIWKEAPVGGEFTSSIAMADLFGDLYDTTKALVCASHMSFVGPNVPEKDQLNDAAENNLEDLLTCIGPRYRVARAELIRRENAGLVLTVCNDGNCPVYSDKEKLVLYITQSDGTVKRIVTDADLTAVVQGKEEKVEVSLPMSYEELVSSAVQAGIETAEGENRMPLFMDAERKDNLSLLFSPEDF